MVRIVAFAIIVIVFVWFFSSMREKYQDYKSRHGGPDYPSDAGDPDGSSGPWGNNGRPKKAQQARSKAEVIEIEPLRAARDAIKTWNAEDAPGESEEQSQGQASEGAEGQAEKAGEESASESGDGS